MSGLNADRIVPHREILATLDKGRWHHGTPHKYTAHHPANDAELIGPGFNDKSNLADYYAGIIDGIIYVEQHPEILNNYRKETK